MNKIIGLVVGLSLFVPLAAFADSNVTASAGTGASITPSGLVVVPTGEVQAFTASANQGYTLSGISVDGVSQVGSSVDFTGLDNDVIDHTIVASATENAPTGGSMPWCSSQLAPGWHVDEVGGGCGSTTTFVPFNGTSCLFNQGCMIKE